MEEVTLLSYIPQIAQNPASTSEASKTGAAILFRRSET